MDAKLVKGGCFTAHNAYAGIKELIDYARNRPDYHTSIDHSSSTGISISCKSRFVKPSDWPGCWLSQPWQWITLRSSTSRPKHA